MLPLESRQKVITYINLIAPTHKVTIDWENSNIDNLNFCFYCDNEIEFVKFMNKVARYYDQLGLKAVVIL